MATGDHMIRFAMVLFAALLSACALATNSASGDPQQTAPPPARRTLRTFDSIAEVKRAMSPVTAAREAQRKREREERKKLCAAMKWDGASCGNMVQETITVTAASAAIDSITNNQHAELDEGGIVKRHGDLLIVLRRGRLFTFGIGGGQLDSLAVSAAYGERGAAPEPDGTWYDELLVWRETVIVVGFSYARGGTEIGIFDLGANGDLRHRDTYHLRSNDYYSRSNYSSRLIGDRLLLFTTELISDSTEPSDWLPAMRRWDGKAAKGPFQSIAPVTRVLRPVRPLNAYALAHSLTSCHLEPSFGCEATVILGDNLSSFYFSPTAAYAWTTAWPGDNPPSTLYRMPLDGSPVTAIGVRGTPTDQFAFLEDHDEHINVVTNTATHSELLRLPLATLSDGTVDAPDSSYRILSEASHWVISRFVGPYVLAAPFSASGNASNRIIAVQFAGDTVVRLDMTHDVERIEAMGDDAVAIGNEGDQLRMTAISLGHGPRIGGTLQRNHAVQSESRSHAFGYRRDTSTSGLFGLPIFDSYAADDAAAANLPAARIVFIMNRGAAFEPAGTIVAGTVQDEDDDCRASCVDWYGNTRPIFVDDRIFALLGYEIVEGRLVDDRIVTMRRIDFTPRPSGRR